MTVSIFYLYRCAQALFTCISTLNRHHWSSWHCCVYIAYWSSNMPPQEMGAYECQAWINVNRSFRRVVSDITVGDEHWIWWPTITNGYLPRFVPFCSYFILGYPSWELTSHIPTHHVGVFVSEKCSTNFPRWESKVRFLEGYRKFGIPKPLICFKVGQCLRVDSQQQRSF